MKKKLILVLLAFLLLTLPVVALADTEGLKPLELRRIQKIVERQREKFRKAWKDFFGV